MKYLFSVIICLFIFASCNEIDVKNKTTSDSAKDSLKWDSICKDYDKTKWTLDSIETGIKYKKLDSILNASGKPFLLYGGEKFYYCCTDYINDTIITPDGSLSITISKKAVYNHFGCDGIK